MMRFVPGGPFDFEQPLPPQVLANIRAAYGWISRSGSNISIIC